MSSTKIVATLTDKLVSREPFATSGQRVIRPRDRKGFFLVVGKDTKTFTIQTERLVLGKRKVHREAVGRFPDIDCRRAYSEADIKLGEVRSGKRAPGQADPGPTLRQAWARFRSGHLERKNRSPRTIEQYVDCLERTLKDWLDTPLRELAENPALVAQRHDEITRKAEGHGGPYQANHCMRCLRAVYLHARKAHKSLPIEHPCVAVDWNPEQERDSAMDGKALKQWWATWATLQNPVRREMHLITLFSATRRGAICEALWEHLRAKERVLHQPKPKGGSKRAFDIPLSRPMLASLARLRRYCRLAYDGSPWMFPSDTSASGHVSEVKENTLDGFPTGHALRHTWITHAQIAGVPKFLRKLITNHGSKGDDVHDGYISVPALRAELMKAQETVARELIRHAPAEAKELLKVRSPAARLKRAGFDDTAQELSRYNEAAAGFEPASSLSVPRGGQTIGT